MLLGPGEEAGRRSERRVNRWSDEGEQEPAATERRTFEYVEQVDRVRGRDCGRIKGLPARQRPHRPVGVLCGEVPDAGFHDRARECVPPLGL